ncbi:stalk domain-containing protein [Gorillibacterium sp. sgz5001074]|uniref:stalk domain-containing protein n=1 Tax=Gorillibacterium sp. sgz5001074 TaxID=3446695 RepID=UPI003F67437A
MNGTWKKALLLAGLMGTCFSAGVWASDGIQKVEAYLRPDFNIVLDGKPVALDKPVLLYNDSSYLPLRKIGELLNATVGWKEETRTVYINSRYNGQPVLEEPNRGPYNAITVEHPFAYQVTYLGGTYTLVGTYLNGVKYYRAADLALMGVDVRALTKSEDTYTGNLYVLSEEAERLFKETPAMNMSATPPVAGTRDPELISKLNDLVKTQIPLMYGGLPIPDLPQLPKVVDVFLVEAVSIKEGYYAAYCNDALGGVLLYVFQVEKNADGKWVHKNTQTTKLEYYKPFFKDLKS